MLKFYKDFHIQPVISGDSPTPTPTPTVKTGYILIGNAADDNGIITVASGKYVISNIEFNFSEADSWAIITKLYYTSGTYDDNGFMGLLNTVNTKCVESYIKRAGQLHFSASSNGSSYNLCDLGTVGNLTTNTWYYVKFEFTGNAYNLYLGSDLNNMILQSNSNSNIKVFNKTGNFVWGKNENPSGIVATSAKFDMNECQIYLNGELYWQGIKN